MPLTEPDGHVLCIRLFSKTYVANHAYGVVNFSV